MSYNRNMKEALDYYINNGYSWGNTYNEMKRRENASMDTTGWREFLSNSDGLLGRAALYATLEGEMPV